MRPRLFFRFLIVAAPWALAGSSSVQAQSATASAHKVNLAVHRALKDNVRHRGIEVHDFPFRTTLPLPHSIDRALDEYRLLAAKRSYFAHLSESVYCTVKSFGPSAELSNVFFCPMALDGKGAFWLSESEQVRNPYMGAAMPGCGELRETFGP